jgi:hypothetical protein
MSKVKANPSSINIGLSEKDRSNIADGLSRMLADKAASCQVIGYSHSTKLANNVSKVAGYAPV